MNSEEDINALRNGVLGMAIGDVRRIPVREIAPGRFYRAHSIYRYRDGWSVLFDDYPAGRLSSPLLPIGFRLNSVEAMTIFLTGDGTCRPHLIYGERL